MCSLSVRFSDTSVYENHLGSLLTCRFLCPSLSNLAEQVVRGAQEARIPGDFDVDGLQGPPIQKSCAKRRYVMLAGTSLLLYVLKVSSQREPPLVLWCTLPFLPSFLLQLQMNIKVNLM